MKVLKTLIGRYQRGTTYIYLSKRQTSKEITVFNRIDRSCSEVSSTVPHTHSQHRALSEMRSFLLLLFQATIFKVVLS